MMDSAISQPLQTLEPDAPPTRLHVEFESSGALDPGAARTWLAGKTELSGTLDPGAFRFWMELHLASTLNRWRLTDISTLWQHVGASTVLRSLLVERQIQSLRRFYDFSSPEEVFRFLETHPDLIPLLDEARSQVAQYFGPFPRVVLEVVRDPEARDSEQLFAYIVTSMPVEEAFERLNQLDQHWFLRQLRRAGGRFNFNLEII